MKTINLYDYFAVDGYYLTQAYLNNPNYYGKFGLKGHEGVDFGHANKDKPVRTCHSGYVFSGVDSAYGKFVIVENKELGVETWYCHQDRVDVYSGQWVNAGDKLGIMGNTGNSYGDHIHFNFVLIDSTGNKKYTAYSQNKGYLDPRYPTDPNPPVYFNGVENYKINWITDLSMFEKQSEDGQSNNMSDEYGQMVSNSIAYDEVCKLLGIPRNSDKDEALRRIKEYKSNLENCQRERDDLRPKLATCNNTLETKDAIIKSKNTKIKELEEAIADNSNTGSETLPDDVNWASLITTLNKLITVIENK